MGWVCRAIKINIHCNTSCALAPPVTPCAWHPLVSIAAHSVNWSEQKNGNLCPCGDLSPSCLKLRKTPQTSYKKKSSPKLLRTYTYTQPILGPCTPLLLSGKLSWKSRSAGVLSADSLFVNCQLHCFRGPHAAKLFQCKPWAAKLGPPCGCDTK